MIEEKKIAIDPGAAQLAALDDAVSAGRVLATDRTIPGNSVVLEHKILVELIQLRRRVVSHNARRAEAAKQAPAAVTLTSMAAAPPAVVAPAVEGAPSPFTPIVPNAPEMNLDPNFQQALEELRKSKP